VASSGAGTLKYQWQKDGANISGATSATYSITSPASGDVGKYTCVVTGDCGTATSNAAALTINAAPSISTQPASVTTCAGNPASFTVAASGTGSIKYQWQKDGTNISSANSATYTISSASTPNAGKYTCIITGDCGSVTSNGATLSITAPPTITTQPIDQSIPIGNSVTFSVQATGTNLSYQWRKNGVNIANANSATYTIAKVSSADAVAYSCSVTAGGCGSVTSKSAYLSVQNHFFGESFGGGLIFYIDGTGQHGLIAASSDQSNPDNNQVWGCGGTSSPTTSNNFGAGSSNTNSIVSGCGGGTNSAAGVCKSYTGGGYTDWYLPSFAELDTLYKNKTSAFNMDQGIYWSSSGDSGGEAVMISFSDGMARQMPLTIAYQVRAIRSF
jgi:hypothetical protein